MKSRSRHLKVVVDEVDDYADASRSVERAFALLDPDTAAARQWASQALSLADPDSTVAGRARHALGMAECLLGRAEIGGDELRRASEILDIAGPSSDACKVWRDRGSVLAFLLGDLYAGLAALEKALGIARTLGCEAEEGAVLSRLAPVLGHAGRHDESRQLLERAEQLLANGPDKEAYAVVLSNLGHNHLLAGEYGRALSFFRKERALRDAKNARLRVANCETNMAHALAGVGKNDEARAVLSGARALLDPATDGHQWVDYLLVVGRVSLFAGAPKEAIEPLLEGLDGARLRGLHRIEIELLAALAMAQEGSGDLIAALQSERDLREAERRWLDEQATARLRTLESDLELERERVARETLERARAELEQRVEERTAELQIQVQKREAAQEKARYWADHDWLTRLPNRRQLKASLKSMLQRARSSGTKLGVLFIDLDGFKEINDSHGHLFGDHVLRVTARRLKRQAPNEAIVTRFGGDEFVVVLPGLSDSEDVLATAQRLRSAIREPVEVHGRQLRFSASIGISVGPGAMSTPEEMLRRADQALLEAKSTGRNRVVELDTSRRLRLDRRSGIRRELEASIEDGRLQPVFQPLWDVRNNRLHGVELLARLSDPDLGSIAPSEFIPVAEESDLIGRVGIWAVAQASAASLALRNRGQLSALDNPRIAVNISTAQLASPTLVDDLTAAVDNAGGHARWLELELTESRQLAENPDVQKRLRDLRALGFTIAIDDFGSGYSSFSYLSNDFFDRLKIDRALLVASSRIPSRAAVIGSIVAMARHLGLDVVGEGAETAQQVELLQAQGCTIVQGFHIARPMSLESLLAWRGPGQVQVLAAGTRTRSPQNG